MTEWAIPAWHDKSVMPLDWAKDVLPIEERGEFEIIHCSSAELAIRVRDALNGGWRNLTDDPGRCNGCGFPLSEGRCVRWCDPITADEVDSSKVYGVCVPAPAEGDTMGYAFRFHDDEWHCCYSHYSTRGWSQHDISVGVKREWSIDPEGEDFVWLGEISEETLLAIFRPLGAPHERT